MQNWVVGPIGLAFALALAGCETGSKPADAKPATVKPQAPATDPLATPRGSLEHQFELLKAQKVDELRPCFTARQQPRITAKAVAAAQADVGKMTMDDLYASETPAEYKGQKTMKVKMKNGRTLTTLVLTDGKWLSDTVWFR